MKPASARQARPDRPPSHARSGAAAARTGPGLASGNRPAATKARSPPPPKPAPPNHHLPQQAPPHPAHDSRPSFPPRPAFDADADALHPPHPSPPHHSRPRAPHHPPTRPIPSPRAQPHARPRPPSSCPVRSDPPWATIKARATHHIHRATPRPHTPSNTRTPFPDSHPRSPQFYASVQISCDLFTLRPAPLPFGPRTPIRLESDPPEPAQAGRTSPHRTLPSQPITPPPFGAQQGDTSDVRKPCARRRG